MKTPLRFKSILFTFLVLLVLGQAYAQSYQTTKTINKNASVSQDVKIKISNYSADLKITTSEVNTVRVISTVKISGKSQVEVEKVLKAIEDFDFDHSANNVNIDTRFYKSMNSVNNRKTITLNNGSKIKIKDLKINHEIQIPKSAHIDLNNKYSDIDMEMLNGSAKFNLYSSTLRAEKIDNQVDVYSKYSKLYWKEIGGNVSLDIYDTDVEFISSRDLNVKSKYSKVKAQQTGSVILDSYDDNFDINQIENLEFVAKYSDLVSQAELTNLQLELYDSNIEIKSAKTASFSGKYCDLKLGNVKDLTIASSYDNDLYLRKTMQIKIDESKYCKYEIAETAGLSIIGYNDNIHIKRLNNNFSEISVKGKYQKIDITTENVPYQLNFKIKYAKIDIPESIKTIKRIEKSSELELVANEKGGLIAVSGYDMHVRIK